MNNSDERDFAEETANRRMMEEEGKAEIAEEKERISINEEIHNIVNEALRLADIAANLHKRVASSQFHSIAASGSKTYEASLRLLKRLIGASYPERTDSDIDDIYDYWAQTYADLRSCAFEAGLDKVHKCFMCGIEEERRYLRQVSIDGQKRLICTGHVVSLLTE